MKQGQRFKIRMLLPAAALVLGACASNPPAPVEDRSSGDTAPPERAAPVVAPATSSEETYRVARGDTLYAIAFKRGVDFRDLASWNHIAPPFRIFVGQELHLRPTTVPVTQPVGVASAVPVQSAAATHGAPAATQNPSVEKSTKPQPSMFENVSESPAPVGESSSKGESVPPPVAPSPKAPIDASKPPLQVAVAKPAEAAPDSVKPAPAQESIKVGVAAAPKSNEPVAELNSGGVHWRWPSAGKVADTFVSGDQTRQGIDIAGRAGDPVQAAADGEVVYSGNGLLGYGELIIVKHNASFLSAYGHNRARLVKEGDKVKAGQQIAEMGSSASAHDELHFEIRKNGKPVNPLEYLPVR